ncbi:hypothetical protein BGZ98_009785 [Dissophora globulifera]|nr:hypothetical protein BGZ98_009785 [Dissophora globulifera]
MVSTAFNSNFSGLKVGGVIGDLFSDLSKYEALVTSSAKIPQCSFSSTHAYLSNNDLFRYFYRTIPSTIVLIDALFEVIRHMGWRRILFIYDAMALGWGGRDYFVAKAKTLDISILDYQPLMTNGIIEDSTYQAVKDSINEKQSRIQVLITTAPTQFDVLREMEKAGYLEPKYAWLTANDISNLMQGDPEAEAYDGVIMIENAWDLKGYAPFDSFQAAWMQLNASNYPGAGDPILSHNEAEVYSCVIMMAEAYGNYIRLQTQNATHGMSPENTFIRDVMQGRHGSDINIPQFFSQTPYEGPSGPVTLDSRGDRQEGYYDVMSLQNGTGVKFASILDESYSVIRDAPFKNGYSTYPKDASPGTLQNPTWGTSCGIVYGSLCAIGIALTVLCAIIIYHFRNNIVIKASSPAFCMCELCGILTAFIWCILHVGIPTKTICIARSFLLPSCITLLIGSLMVKNYRIHRIFNSAVVQNQVFKTWLLLSVVGASVIISIIPVIVGTIVDPPVPTGINIHSYQWISCQSERGPLVWHILPAIVPSVITVFGVFLTYKTRNVAYLWNEAREIALVLYNVLIFTIIICIAIAFPQELYMVTFYMVIVATFSAVLLALVVLFLPKFLRIICAYRHTKRRGSGGLWQDYGGSADGDDSGRLGPREEIHSRFRQPENWNSVLYSASMPLDGSSKLSSSDPCNHVFSYATAADIVAMNGLSMRDRLGSDATAVSATIASYDHEKIGVTKERISSRKHSYCGSKIEAQVAILELEEEEGAACNDNSNTGDCSGDR